MLFPPVVKIGPHLKLTTAYPCDAAAIMAAWDGAATGPGWHHDKPATVEAERAYLERMLASPHDHLFLINRFLDRWPFEETIGTIGLHIDSARDEHAGVARLGLLMFNAASYGDPRFPAYEETAVLLAARLTFYYLHRLRCLYVNIDVDDVHEHALFTRLGFIEAVPGRTLTLKKPDGSDRPVWEMEIRPDLLPPENE